MRGETQETSAGDRVAAPILEALATHLRRRATRFHVPGHKGGRGAFRELRELFGPALLRLDLTELGGLDDPANPRPDGPIDRAGRLAADVWAASRARLLFGGATAGVTGLILALTGPGDVLLATAPFHRSVVAGAILSGCMLRVLPPRLIGPAALPAPAAPETVAEALARHRPRAVLVTSPTYHGLVADVARVATVCREHGVPLLVDGAHGAHLGLAESLPPSPLEAGASAVVLSLHKTAGALTPGAVVVLGPARTAGSGPADGPAPSIDPDHLDAALRLVQTSSPSWPVLASLDVARRRLALHGKDDWARAVRLAEETRAAVRRGAPHWFRPLVPATDFPGDVAHDPTRLVFVLDRDAPPGLTGLDVGAALAAAGVDVEMAGWAEVVLVVTPADTPKAHRRLVGSLLGVLEQVGELGASLTADTPARAGRLGGRESALALEKECWEAAPDLETAPADAFRRSRRWVPLVEAAGRLAADVVCPYPPGVPLVVPGQRLWPSALRYLELLVGTGGATHGLRPGPVERDRGGDGPAGRRTEVRVAE